MDTSSMPEDPFDSRWARKVEARFRRRERLRRLFGGAAPARSRRRLRRIGTGLLVVGLLGTAGWHFRSEAASVLAAVRGDAVDSDFDVDREPFAGTPAADFAPAEDLAPPPAEAVDGWSREAVAERLDHLVETLTLARVDYAMTASPDPNAYLERFAEYVRDGRLPETLDSPYRLNFVTAIDGDAEVLEIRAEVEFVVRAATDEQGRRQLQVDVSAVWAYQFAGAGGRTADYVTVLNDKSTWLYHHPEDHVAAAEGLSWEEVEFWALNMDCELLDDGRLAPPTELPPSGLDDEGESLYDTDVDFDALTPSCPE